MESGLTRLKWEGPVGGVKSTVTPGDVTSLHCPVKSVATERVWVSDHDGKLCELPLTVP